MENAIRNQMIIFPERADAVIPEQLLRDCLAAIGLLAEAETESRFLPGEAFLKLICFLGCSPNIELAPNQENRPYCSIETGSSADKIQCLFGSNTKAPNCPVCRKAITALIPEAQDSACHFQQCRECQAELDLSSLNWRKTAVFARTWIVVNNIFEAEAVPHDDLLDRLQQETGVAWKIAYLRGNIR